MERIDYILEYWFAGLNDDQVINKKSVTYKRWFASSRSMDEEIRKEFQSDLQKATAGGYTHWEKTVRGRLALIILFDQMARNMYRQTAQMFSFDSSALNLALRSIKEGLDIELPLIQRSFLYMPLMHAEDLKAQELSLEKFQQLVTEAKVKSPLNRSYYQSSLEYAQRHYSIIKQFGRFPHRNTILNRVSSSEESAFLAKKGSFS